MATSWPKKRRLIGTRVARIDGPAKSTGRAKYSYDINRPGMLFGKMLRSPYAHCKITTLDTSAAEASPGFKALHIIAKPGSELFFIQVRELAEGMNAPLVQDREDLLNLSLSIFRRGLRRSRALHALNLKSKSVYVQENIKAN